MFLFPMTHFFGAGKTIPTIGGDTEFSVPLLWTSSLDVAAFLAMS
jgi:hypothetical protein